MKTNQEILDTLGKALIKKLYDRHLIHIHGVEPKVFSNSEKYKNLFAEFTGIKKYELEEYVKELLSGGLFEFLCLFEEQQAERPGRFRLIYEEDGKQVDMVEISEMLKAEPIIENGWIDRFSEYAKISKENK